MAAAAACGRDAPAPPGPTAPGPTLPAPTLEVAADSGAVGDTLFQRGLAFTARLSAGPMEALTVTTDSGAADARRTTFASPRCAGVARFPEVAAAVFPPAPGPRTLAFAAADTARRVAAARLARTFVVADAPYVAVPLPDIGGEADALALNERGDVAGWVSPPRAPAGAVRAAVWQGAAPALAVLPVTDSAGVRAVRINAAGDVLLQYFAPPGVFTPRLADPRAAARVWRADGRLLVPAGVAGAPAECCVQALDLNDRGQALLGGGARTWVYDLASAAFAGPGPDALGAPAFLNDAGQAAATTSDRGRDIPRVLSTTGLPPLRFPPARPPSTCGRLALDPLPAVRGLDDEGTVLALVQDGYPAVLSAAGPRALDVFLGADVREVALSRRGGWVAGLDTAGTLYLWNARDPRSRRVRPPDGWRFDRLGAINAAGQIAAHGVDPATGRPAAVRLSPAGG